MVVLRITLKYAMMIFDFVLYLVMVLIVDYDSNHFQLQSKRLVFESKTPFLSMSMLKVGNSNQLSSI